MIRANITREYPTHIARCDYTDNSLYLADYTQQTSNVRGVEIFESTPPTDIDSFELRNDAKLRIGYIKFDNTSFVYSNGSTRSQCECVIFPETSSTDSWVLFAELKYSHNSYRNNKHIKKAIKQLYLTRTYYFNSGVFTISNTCYLFISLPMQAEPFAQSVISPTDLQSLKRRHNVILRLQNHAAIQNDKIIIV